MKSLVDEFLTSGETCIPEDGAARKASVFKDRVRRALARIVDYGILGLIVFTPLPAASVHSWSVLAIQLTVLILVAVYFLMPKKPQPNRVLNNSARWPRFLACGFFVFLVIQVMPLPTFLVKLISPNVYILQREYAPAAATPGFLSISLIPSETLRAGSELLAYFLVGFLILRTITSTRQIRRLMGVIIAMGIFEALYGMFELYNKDPRILFYPKVYNLDSVTGTFVNRNHFSGYLEMVLPLALGLVMSRLNIFSLPGLKLRERLLAVVGKGFLMNLGLMAGILSMSIAIVFSRSRSGIFVMILMFILFLGFTVFLKERPAEQIWIRRFLRILFLVIVMSSVYIGIGSTIQRFSLDKMLLEGRPMFWVQTLQWIGRFPVFGTGLGTFASLYPGFEVEGTRFHIYHAHNDYLEYLMEAGAIGFLFLAGIIVLMLWCSFRAWQTRRFREVKVLAIGCTISCLSILIHSVSDFNMHIPANMLLFSAVLSLTMVVSFHKKRGQSLASPEGTS